MKKLILLQVVMLSVFFLAGCSLKAKGQRNTPVAVGGSSNECMAAEPQHVRYHLKANEGDEKLETVRVSATGYGAPPKEYYPEYQRRLMAMRAAKIDAYRALAETINGLHIWGGTTLGDMAVQSDNYRVFLNSYVRGATVESVTERQDGNYETSVSTIVDQNFLSYMVSKNLLHSADCDAGSASKAQGQAGLNNSLSPVVYSDGAAPSNFYYSE